MTQEEFETLAGQVAAELGKLRGEEWGVTRPGYPGKYGADLNGPGSTRLRLSAGWDGEGKVSISTLYPEGTSGRTWRANVNPARGPQVIAREANRRVIGAGYLDDLEQAKDRKEQQDRREQAEADLMAQVAALFGMPPPGPGNLYLGECVRGTGHVGTYWDYADGSLALDIDLTGIPAQTALAMLEVLAGDPGSQAICCRKYGPGHDERLSSRGCRHASPGGRTPAYDEGEALSGLYHRSGSGQTWEQWLGRPLEDIHPAWR